MANKKFSNFTVGDEVQISDELVGLRPSAPTKNFKFEFPGTGIKDANGNFLLQWVSAGTSAVNNFQFTSSLTSNSLFINALGSDTDIDITLSPKGIGSVLVPTPTVALAATTKAYVDGLTDGTEFFDGTQAGSTGNFSSVYDNGASGVGATLTATSNGAAVIDGFALAVDDFVLFKDQTTTFENGVYELTTNGTGGTPSIFTRSVRFDSPGEIHVGNGVSIAAGTVNISTIWIQTEKITTIGADPILFIPAEIASTGPSTDNAVVRFDGVTGKIIQNSGVIISDADVMTGVTQLNVDNVRLDGNALSSTDTNGNVDVIPDGTGGLTINTGAVKIDTLLDEDDMVSDSDTALATQQSIKAFVDNSIGVTPIYRVKLSANQSVNPSTSTKVEFATEIFDTNSDYDPVLFRFTPTSAGKYLITASIFLDSIGSGDFSTVSIFKNGVEDSQNFYRGPGAMRDQNTAVTAIIDMNGTTDFIEIFAFHDDAGAEDIVDNVNSFVCGHRIVE